MAHERIELDTLTLKAKPMQMGGPANDLPEGTEYTVFDLRMHVNGTDILNPEDQFTTIDGAQLWLAQRYNRRSWLLTCSCGTPECAGFYEPVATVRHHGRLSWTFPVSYFEHLLARKLVSGKARPVTFTFDAREVYAQFEAVQGAVFQYESLSGKASAFSAGSHSRPLTTLAQQFVRAHAWYLLRNKHRRYARYVGLRAGICAGAPSPDRGGNVK